MIASWHITNQWIWNENTLVFNNKLMSILLVSLSSTNILTIWLLQSYYYNSCVHYAFVLDKTKLKSGNLRLLRWKFNNNFLAMVLLHSLDSWMPYESPFFSVYQVAMHCILNILSNLYCTKTCVCVCLAEAL